MKLPPASVLESWPAPNYKNPETRGKSLIILNSILLGLMTTFVILRLYTRLFVRVWFGWDDGFIIAAYISTVLMNIAVDFGSERYGWTRHAWDIPFSMATNSYKLAYFAKLPFLFAGFFTASSLLAFYYRLIQESGVTWFRVALHCSTVFNILAWLPFLLTEIFICTPIHAYWTYPEPAGSRCLDDASINLVGGSVKLAVDLLITTLPIPLILHMNMQKRQRYLITILLSLGYIVTAAGAVRLYFTWKALYGTNDLTWYQYPAFVASAIENNVAVICACIPTIRPLFPHLLGGPISKIRNWIASKTSTHQKSTTDQSGSNGSEGSRMRSSFRLASKNDVPFDKRGISVPTGNMSSSSDTDLVIQRPESFELVEKSVQQDGILSHRQKTPDSYSFNDNFDPRQDGRKNFHAF